MQISSAVTAGTFAAVRRFLRAHAGRKHRMLAGLEDERHPLAERFRDFIRTPGFSCVGAKSALARNQMRIIVARDISSAWDDLRILPELIDFTAAYRENRQLYQSFVVLFENRDVFGEDAFETHLWSRLQSLSDKDEWLGQQVDHRVSQDPDHPHFSLSFGGEAYFVVGLHPGASRVARRFERPALVFNLHDQFERLRGEGLYDRLRDTILQRDLALDGTANPMLQRFGENSEARQYSGRAVDSSWRCPFSGRGVSPVAEDTDRAA
jgi:FPC/CPF motif-containing protein YcgG